MNFLKAELEESAMKSFYASMHRKSGAHDELCCDKCTVTTHVIVKHRRKDKKKVSL
jgi:hypothetical protein